MTYGEIMDSIEQFCYQKYIETEENNYMLEALLTQIGRAIYQIPINNNIAILGKSSSYPKITDYLPDRVVKSIEAEQEKNKARQQDLKFMAWAERVNRKFKAKEASALANINEKISNIGK